MTDFTWYSRLLVWVGALVLLIQSITGRPYGSITVLAVIMLAAGLLAFIGGLSVEGRPSPAWLSMAPEAPPPPTIRRVVAPGRTAADPASSVTDESSLEPHLADTAGSAAPEVTAEPLLQENSAPPARVRSGAAAMDLAADDPFIGRPCFRCHAPLSAGQTAAVCPECGGAHHATCWVGNHFHCGREGCGGHGSLQAPEA